MSEAKSVTQLRNWVIALTAIALSIAIFFGLQSQSTAFSLEAQAKQSLSPEIALSNGKPTITEFYADWCGSCQAMTKDLAQLKRKYADSVNFVMLNVDNNKWLPEVLRYRVDGIPHFVYFAANGEEIAQAVGEQPFAVMDANLSALVTHTALPYAAATGNSSPFEAPARIKNSDPRTHSSQVRSSENDNP